MIYWDKIYGTNLWLEKINSIKQKYPKEDLKITINEINATETKAFNFFINKEII